MGLRTDQHMGLNSGACSFVKGSFCTPLYTEEGTRTFSDGSVETFKLEVFAYSVKKEVNDFYMGMFEDAYPLYKYTFPDGKEYFERVQACPWSSGPVFFLALQDREGNWVTRFLWSNEEIENA